MSHVQHELLFRQKRRRYSFEGAQEAQDTVQAFGGVRGQPVAVLSAVSFDYKTGRVIAAEVPSAPSGAEPTRRDEEPASGVVRRDARVRGRPRMPTYSQLGSIGASGTWRASDLVES